MAEETKEYLDYEGLSEYHKKSEELFQDLTIEEVEEAFNELDESDPSYSAFYDVITKAKEATAKTDEAISKAETATTNATEATSKADEATDRANKAAEKLETVNDFTTGINLIRGSRDFRLGSEVSSFPPYYADGFLNGYYTFSKDEEGFTVASHNTPLENNSYVSLYSSAFAIKNNDEFTISFEYMIDDINEQSLNGNNVFMGGFEYAKVGTSTRVKWYDANVNKDLIKSGVWGTFVQTIKITETSNDNHYGYFRFQHFKEGSIHFRKLMIQKGRIKNPIWAPAPADLSLEPINDITTMPNLLRETRDFIAGTERVSTNPVWGFADGWDLGTHGASTIYHDDQGYAICNIKRLDAQASVVTEIQTSVVKGISVGDTYTLVFDFMIDNVGELNVGLTPLFGALRGVTDKISVVDSVSIVSSNIPEILSMKSGEWYTFKLTTTITNPDAKYVNAFFRLTGSGSINFRKVAMYKGRINNPTWSLSPFDIDYVNETGINLLRGTRDFTSGTKKIANSVCFTDGWYIPTSSNSVTFSSYLDKDGFTVEKLTVKTENTGTNNLYAVFQSSGVYGIKSNEQLTLSYEVMIDDISQFVDLQVLAIAHMKANGELAGSHLIDHSFSKLGITLKSGEWYKVVYSFSSGSITYDSDDYLVIKLQLPVGANSGTKLGCSINYRKACLYRGKLVNPIWSASPFDIDYIPETGINLLRGTRDFTQGTTKVLNSNYVKDGWLNSGPSSSTYVDSDGFTVVKLNGNMANSRWHSMIAEPIKNGDIVTVSFDFKIDNPSVYFSTDKMILQTHTRTASGDANITRYTVEQAGFNSADIKADTWYRAVININAPIDIDNVTSFMFVSISIASVAKNAFICFKKVAAYKGRINNPEWSASPFDVPSITIEQDILPRKGVLPAGTDWGTLTANGRWLINRDTQPNQKGYPEGSYTWGVLEVIRITSGTKANDDADYILQRFTETQNPCNVYTRCGMVATIGERLWSKQPASQVNPVK